MTLSAAALCTVAVCLDELDIVDADARVRARIERYIESASSLIGSILGNGSARQLHAIERTVTVAGMDHPTLILPHTPIVSIAEISIDGAVVDAADYEVENADAGFVRALGGVWPADMLATSGVVAVGVPGTERRNISVTFTAGWLTPAQGNSTLPAAIEDAAVELVTSRYRRRGQTLRVAGEALAKSSYNFGGVGVPAEVMAALAPYIRVAHA